MAEIEHHPPDRKYGHRGNLRNGREVMRMERHFVSYLDLTPDSQTVAGYQELAFTKSNSQYIVWRPLARGG